MEVIDHIRQTANILEIASQYTTLKRSGRRHVGLCPFHSEKSPSFFVDDDKQLYHCFGCGAGGDIFTLLMEKERFSFPETVRFLAEEYNIPLPDDGGDDTDIGCVTTVKDQGRLGFHKSGQSFFQNLM